MAMVLQPSRVTNSNSSTVPMDSFKTLQSANNQEDSFYRKVFDTIEEGKRDKDPIKCRQILDDFMTMLKHLTADVNNYNLAFCETRPRFYMQEFQRLTDRIETLTKARNTLEEFLHELDDQQIESNHPDSSSNPEISSIQQQGQCSPATSPSIRSSPPEKTFYPQSSSLTSIQSATKEIFLNDHPANLNSHESYLSSSSFSANPNNRSRSPSITPNNFIRVHFPNKHTTALAPRSDETLETALEARALRHSVNNLHDYAPVYKASRQPCPWDTRLDRALETEIELEQKSTLDHSFKDIQIRRFHLLIGERCDACRRRIHEMHKFCKSCGNHYHNDCCSRAPVCTKSNLHHMKHLPPDRHGNDRVTAIQSRNKEQSRSLPRIPISRPGININPRIGPQKDISQETTDPPLSTSNNTSSFPNTLQSAIPISSSHSSSSLYQPLSTVASSSLPTTAAPIHHIPHLLRTGNGSALTSPQNLRPSMPKPNVDGINDNKKASHKHVSEWQIRPDDLLNRGRMVGRGTYGTVYKAEVRLHGQVALKELNFVSPTSSQLQAFKNEVSALKKITHQNTLNFYGYIISPRFAIVTQWCEGSTLYKHIHILDRHWKISQLIDIARQICQGMSYLHDREIIHRDLKSSNVFLDTSAEPDDTGGNWRVKIGDFGLAAVKALPAEGFNQQVQPSGSVLWMAPEVIQQRDPTCYSTKSDVYAYGCVLFEMFSGKLPHAPITNKEQIIWLVGKGRLKIKVEQCRDDTPEAITELIRQCSEYDRSKRPNFAPEIDDTLSKFEFIFPRLQRSQSEPYLIRGPQDDLLGLSINIGVPKTPISIHRRFNAEVS